MTHLSCGNGLVLPWFNKPAMTGNGIYICLYQIYTTYNNNEIIVGICFKPPLKTTYSVWEHYLFSHMYYNINIGKFIIPTDFNSIIF
jgi:hypothetical protein